MQVNLLLYYNGFLTTFRKPERNRLTARSQPSKRHRIQLVLYSWATSGITVSPDFFLQLSNRCVDVSFRRVRVLRIVEFKPAAAAGRHASPKRKFGHREIGTGYAGKLDNGHNKNDRVCRRSEGGKGMCSEKKRKYSSVTWGKEDACARVSSKHGSSLLTKKPKNGDVHLNSVYLDVNVVCDDVQVKESLRNGDGEFRSAGSTVTESSNEKMVEDSDTSPLHISKSKWASDDDTHVRKEYVSRKDCLDRHSSPEIGEFIRDDSEGGILKSMSDEDRENDHGAVVDEEYRDSKGDDEIIQVPRNVIWDSCRSVYDYEMLNKINEGTYGVVYRARNKITGEIVALKRVKLDRKKQSFPNTALREINLLMSFDHPSLVRGKEIVMGDLDSVFVVMEYMEHDLKGLLEVMKHPFSISEVKCLMLQLLEGVQYLHDNWVIHRDLKSSNILFNNQGELKICDFGMARQYADPLRPYTANVVTLWYRAPEILFGAKPFCEYSEAVDMWSVGCIMAELVSREPLFPGKTEVDQVDKIIRLLGTPNDTIWPGFSELPGVKSKFVKQPYNLLRKKFPATSFTGAPALTDAGFDLLNRMLTYDPIKRITVHEALDHPWFHEVPLAKDKEFMPTYPAQNQKDRTRKQEPRK